MILNSLQFIKAGRMDQDQRAKFLQFLNEKWKDQTCEVCKNGTWTISGDSVTPVILKSGGMTLGGMAYPQTMVSCLTCGNTKFFNTVITGFYKREEKKKEENKENQEGQNAK